MDVELRLQRCLFVAANLHKPVQEDIVVGAFG